MVSFAPNPWKPEDGLATGSNPDLAMEVGFGDVPNVDTFVGLGFGKYVIVVASNAGAEGVFEQGTSGTCRTESSDAEGLK
jgi:hypothetical protein